MKKQFLVFLLASFFGVGIIVAQGDPLPDRDKFCVCEVYATSGSCYYLKSEYRVPRGKECCYGNMIPNPAMQSWGNFFVQEMKYRVLGRYM